jgi:predicted acylesterase/phospholipase RssA
MPDTSHAGLDTVLTATDLVTGNAMRFGSARSSCSPLGTITEPVSVATAVAASAAFPALLPAIERTYTFERTGQQTRHTVLLTDGGVYDNLGTSSLEPGRSTTFTPHVDDDVRCIVACDAGRGAPARIGPHFRPGRMQGPSRSRTAKRRTRPAPGCTNGLPPDVSTDAPLPVSACATTACRPRSTTSSRGSEWPFMGPTSRQ